MKGFLIAFSMFSRIPMPHIERNEKNLKYVGCYIPFIGALIGLLDFLCFYIFKSYSINLYLTAFAAAGIPLAIARVYYKNIVMCLYYLVIFTSLTFFEEYWQMGIFSVLFFASRAVAVIFAISTEVSEGEEDVLRLKKSSDVIVTALFSLVYIIISVALMEYFNIIAGVCVVVGLLILSIYFNICIFKKQGGIKGDALSEFVSLCEVAGAIVIAFLGLVI